MARHSYNISNATGAAVRADLNNALAAIQSVNSGSGTPADTVAYQYFIDTSASPALIKQRNADNDGNILLGEVDGQSYFSNGTQSKPSISFRNDTNLGLRRNSADKLSIVTGGADRVTVDTNGMSIGNTTPSSNFHVENTPNADIQITGGPNGLATLKLGNTDDANIGKIQYNNSSNSLAFDTNNSTRLTIDSSGNLSVSGGNITNGSPAVGTSGFDLQNDGVHRLGRNAPDGNSVLRVSGGSGELRVKGNGDCQNTNNTYTVISDEKLKENIVDATSQWDDIKGVRIRNYNLKASTGYSTHRQIGVVAQELETVCPGLVKDSNDEDADGNVIGTTKAVLSSVLYMKAVKALQEAMDRIETLEAKVAALEASN